jgi:hypothetical protein
MFFIVDKVAYMSGVVNESLIVYVYVLNTSLNNILYVDSIYPNKLKIKRTTEYSSSASYSDILLKLDTNGKLTTNGTILISPSSTFLTYTAIFQFHLHMVFISHN